MDAFPAGQRSPVLLPAPCTAPLLRVETATAAGHQVVLLHGEVDVTAGAVLEPLRAQLAARGLPVVLDASGVAFMDCAGLAAVLSLTPDGDLASVTGASGPVRVLLEAAARAEVLGRAGGARGRVGGRR